MKELSGFLTPILISMLGAMIAALAAVGWYFIQRVINKIDDLTKITTKIDILFAEFRLLAKEETADFKIRVRRIERQTEASLAIAKRVSALEEDVLLIKESNFGSKTTN